MATNDIQQLFDAQNAQPQKLHAIVAKTMEEEGLIVNNFKNPPQEIRSRGQKYRVKRRALAVAGSLLLRLPLCFLSGFCLTRWR